MKHLEAIPEAAYLTVMNAPQYRRIMRIFYTEYEKMHFQLYKEDVLERMREQPEFSEYTMDQLRLDLEALVTWKNLMPIQDPRRVYTIAEYKNKQFRYSMSDYAVEIERLTVNLENLFMESSNLSANYFVRIEEALHQMDRITGLPLKEVNVWWHNLQEDFRRLNRNYQDYLREFYSGRADKVLKSVEFLLHKDHFVSYLRDFVVQLQGKTVHIENLLNTLKVQQVEAVLGCVVASQLEVPHPDAGIQNLREQNIQENVTGKWDALWNWFVSSPRHTSESRQVMDITDEIIRKIIQNAALIVQLQNWGISRKDDYSKFMHMFADCADMEEAHKLAAHVFGIQHIRHLKGNVPRSTESTNTSVYEEEASRYELKSHTRVYKPRMQKAGIENKSLEKLALRNQYLKSLDADRALVMKYVRNNRLEIASIENRISENTRMTLLRWIAQANLTKTMKGRTEYGQAYRLVKKEGSHTLKCEDGDLVLPVYVLEFEGMTETAEGVR